MGFSLWGLVLARTKVLRLKPMPLDPPTLQICKQIEFQVVS